MPVAPIALVSSAQYFNSERKKNIESKKRSNLCIPRGHRCMIHDLLIRSSQEQSIVTTTKLFKSYSLHNKKKCAQRIFSASIDRWIYFKKISVFAFVVEKILFLSWTRSESKTIYIRSTSHPMGKKLAATAIVAPHTSWISLLCKCKIIIIIEIRTQEWWLWSSTETKKWRKKNQFNCRLFAYPLCTHTYYTQSPSTPTQTHSWLAFSSGRTCSNILTG